MKVGWSGLPFVLFRECFFLSFFALLIILYIHKLIDH